VKARESEIRRVKRIDGNDDPPTHRAERETSPRRRASRSGRRRGRGQAAPPDDVPTGPAGPAGGGCTRRYAASAAVPASVALASSTDCSSMTLAATCPARPSRRAERVATCHCVSGRVELRAGEPASSVTGVRCGGCPRRLDEHEVPRHLARSGERVDDRRQFASDSRPRGEATSVGSTPGEMNGATPVESRLTVYAHSSAPAAVEPAMHSGWAARLARSSVALPHAWMAAQV